MKIALARIMAFCLCALLCMGTGCQVKTRGSVETDVIMRHFHP